MGSEEKFLAFSNEVILSKIIVVRQQKVMLDKDLALLYQVETKQLKRQVKRNIERFPSDFMFELTAEENEILRYQFGTLSWGEHSKYLSYCFTEHGILMLSTVLKSTKAIQVNIEIMRVFSKMRQALSDTTELRLDIEQIKHKLHNHDKNIEVVFRYLDELIEKNEHPVKLRTKIGFKTKNTQ